MQSEILEYIVSCANAAPSADNSQPWHLIWDGHTLQLQYDGRRVAGKTFSGTSLTTFLTMGAVLENLYRSASHCNFPLSAEILPAAPSAETVYARITGIPEGDLPSTIGDNPVFARHTNRFAYDEQALPGVLMSDVSAMDEGDAQALWFTGRDDKRSIGSLIRRGSIIRFQTPEVHVWLGDSLRFGCAEQEFGEGLDVESLDLPPGGIAFLKLTRSWQRMNLLNKLGAYRFMAGIDSPALNKAPGLLAIVGKSTPEGAIAAGRLLNRVWTFLNQQQLAVHPYFVVSDQLNRFREGTVPEKLRDVAESLAQDATKFFALGKDDTLFMVLRVGVPRRGAPKSRRLPLQRVFTDVSGDAPSTLFSDGKDRP